jgi:hypothetical protein
MKRREFVGLVAGAGMAGGEWMERGIDAMGAQEPGERPVRPEGVKVLNPRDRVPVGIIIDDSTTLVNLNKFAVPQFAQALGPDSHHARLPWREWADEIPDSFVRRFAEWSAVNGVKGKYSIVPYPACVGRIDRMLPGWTQAELAQSIDLVRREIMPNWDIHPEMITHTRVIDLKTGHPYEDFTPKYMENWEWSAGRSAEELTDYLRYALQILKNVGLPCEGITTPGGFGSKARPQLARAVGESLRDVFKAEIPHYFRDLYADGEQSVAPLVQNVSGLETDDPRCVVHTIGCTGDWTGGWDNTTPVGTDRFISADGATGRLVDVIRRGEPALLVCHWTGIWFNGQELGFKIFQEVVKRLHARFDNLHWMKLSEVSRYWAAKELTAISVQPTGLAFKAPFACPEFTVEWRGVVSKAPVVRAGRMVSPLREVKNRRHLVPGTWYRDGAATIACLALPKGASQLVAG